MGTVLLSLLLLVPDWTVSDAAARREAVQALTWPDGVVHVPVLIEMRMDDDAGVRAAAAVKLHEFGQRALTNYVRFLKNPKDPARVEFREGVSTSLEMGAAVTPGFLAEPMAAPGEHSRRAGAALMVAYPFPPRYSDALLDVLHAALADADAGVRSMATTALALQGWLWVSERHPLRDSAPLIALLDDKQEAVNFAATALLASLWPRDSPARAALRAKSEADDAPPGMGLALLLTGADEPPSEGVLEEITRTFAYPGGAAESDISYALYRARSMGAAAKPFEVPIRAVLARAKGELALRAGAALLAISRNHASTVTKKLAPFLEQDADPVLQLRAVAVLAEAGAPDLAKVLRWKEPPSAGASLAAQYAVEDELFLAVLRAKRFAAAGLVRAESIPDGARKDLAALQHHKDARLRYLAALALR